VSATGDEPRSPARLSPFVFPSDTTFRFALLVVAVLGANLYVWNWLWIAVGTDRREVASGYLACTEEHQAAVSSARDVDAFGAASDALSACIREVQLPLAWWMLGGTGLLIAVAVAIMLVLPRWIVWRRRLRPLTREDAPAVVDELATLAREAELREEPRWLWSPLDPSPTGLAFGRPGSHAVALMGGLVVRQLADPPAFRSVVRHELAHLRNRDVDLTYATVSLWYAFLLTGVLPFAIVVADEGASTVLALGWRLLALAGLVFLTRNAVLRAREVYADVRASVPDGSEGALRRILAGLPRRHASQWGRLRSVHPDPTTRLGAVNDTRRLFPLGLLVTFGAGVAATIAYESLVTFIGIFVDDPLTMRLLAAAAFAPLAMGVVGVGVWRGAWGALADDRARPSTWPLALALAAGFLVGPQLALERGVRVEGDTTLLETALGSGAPWIAAVVAGSVLLLAWVGTAAAAWIRALAGSARPAVTTAMGLVVASGLLAAFVGIFYTARDARSIIDVSRGATRLEHAQIADLAWVGPAELYLLLRDPQILWVLTQPVVFLALVALWLFPLAAWLRRRDRVSDAPWAFLEPGGRLHVTLLGRVSLDPWRVGVAVGVASLAALLVVRVALRASFEPETRARLEFLFAFFYWQFVVALVAQGVAAAVVVARARDGMPLVGALAAAFTAGTIATAGIVVGPSVAGCVDAIAMNPAPCAWDVDAGFTWFVLRQVVAEGAMAALAGGLVVLGVRAILAWRRVPVARPPADVAR
jgi:Zn-dependent protease with chaperone function